MPYQDFPRFQWPSEAEIAALAALGFEDTSHINDACPSFESDTLKVFIDPTDEEFIFTACCKNALADVYAGNSLQKLLKAISAMEV